MIASRRSSSASSSQPSSCTTMPGLMPSRAAMPALSTLIPAAPPWVGLLLTGRRLDGGLSGPGMRADASQSPVLVRDGKDGAGARPAGWGAHDGHDRRERSPQPGHVTPLVLAGNRRPAVVAGHPVRRPLHRATAGGSVGHDGPDASGVRRAT